MRFKKSPQLPGSGRTRARHHNGSHTPTSPGAILLSKMASQPKHIGRQCKSSWFFLKSHVSQISGKQISVNWCDFWGACLKISVIVVVDNDSQFFESLPKCYFRRCYFWTPQKHRSTKFLSSNQLVTNNTGLRGDSLTLPRSNSLWHYTSKIV